MRKLSAYLLAALLLAACTPEQPAGENTFYVSIPPLRSIVEGIVGDDFKIEVLVPPGASPETFEPTPRQFVELNKAQLIFNVGLIDFETTLLGKVGDQAKVVNLSRGIDLIAGSCSGIAAPALRTCLPAGAYAGRFRGSGTLYGQ